MLLDEIRIIKALSRKSRRGRYSPVNQAGFRTLFMYPMGEKPRRGKRRIVNTLPQKR